MTYLKMGPLAQVINNLTGVTDKLVRPIHNAGQPVTAMNNDGNGAIPDAIGMGNAGNFLYRVVRDGSEFWSLPDYNLEPEESSFNHTAKLWQHVDTYVKDHLDLMKETTGKLLKDVEVSDPRRLASRDALIIDLVWDLIGLSLGSGFRSRTE